MTDLEITRLCAKAMGYECVEWSRMTPPPFPCGMAAWNGKDDTGRPFNYDPIHDDAQAMALVKRMSLQIHHHGCADNKASLVTVTGKWVPYAKEFKVCADNLNRAIVQCVADMQASKS